jgi:hypothetical protein
LQALDVTNVDQAPDTFGFLGVKRIMSLSEFMERRTPSIQPKHKASSSASEYVAHFFPDDFLLNPSKSSMQRHDFLPATCEILLAMKSARLLSSSGRYSKCATPALT